MRNFVSIALALSLIPAAGCRVKQPQTSKVKEQIGGTIGNETVNLGDGFFMSGLGSGAEHIEHCLKFASRASAGLLLNDPADGSPEAAPGDGSPDQTVSSTGSSGSSGSAGSSASGSQARDDSDDSSAATVISDSVPAAMPADDDEAEYGRFVTLDETENSSALTALIGNAYAGGGSPGARDNQNQAALALDDPSTTEKPPQQIGNQDAGYYLYTSDQARESSVKLGVDVGVKTPAVEVNVSSKTEIDNTRNSNALHLVTHATYVKNARTIDRPVLDSDIANAIVDKKTGKLDKVEFMKRCGQAMVRQIVYGSRVAGTLSISGEKTTTAIKQKINADVKYGNKLTRRVASVDVSAALDIGVKAASNNETIVLTIKASGLQQPIDIPDPQTVLAKGANAVVKVINDAMAKETNLGVAYSVLAPYGNITYRYTDEGGAIKTGSDYVDSPLFNANIKSFLPKYRRAVSAVNDALLALQDAGVAEGSSNFATLGKVNAYREALDKAMNDCLENPDTACKMPADALAGLGAEIPATQADSIAKSIEKMCICEGMPDNLANGAVRQYMQKLLEVEGAFDALDTAWQRQNAPNDARPDSYVARDDMQAAFDNYRGQAVPLLQAFEAANYLIFDGTKLFNCMSRLAGNQAASGLNRAAFQKTIDLMSGKEKDARMYACVKK